MLPNDPLIFLPTIANDVARALQEYPTRFISYGIAYSAEDVDNDA